MTNDKKINFVDIHHDTSDKISSTNFDVLKKHMSDNNSKTLLFATAPWCGHCQALKPVLQELKTKFKDHSGKGVIAHIDDKHHEKLKSMTENLEINGYPSVKILHGNKEKLSHSGPRDISTLSDIVNKTFPKKGGMKKKVKKTKKNHKVKKYKSKHRSKHTSKHHNKHNKTKHKKNMKRKPKHKTKKSFMSLFKKFKGNLFKLKNQL
jgi:thiol-disulfide isomerase/thioredoxin